MDIPEAYECEVSSLFFVHVLFEAAEAVNLACRGHFKIF